MIAPAQDALLLRWRQLVAGQAPEACPRPLAALGYLVHGPVADDLVELDKLVLVLLSDASHRGGDCWLKLVGVGGRSVRWGVRWGGVRQSKFLKNLSLQPMPHAKGRRTDLTDTDLLQLGLDLELELQRHARCRWLPVRRSVQLPRVWAGFRPEHLSRITGDGPELAAQCGRTGKSAQRLLEDVARQHLGLTLLPLDWVSHHWREAVAFYADLSRFPQRQVFDLRGPTGSLRGYQGALKFDFVSSRFSRRRRPVRRRRTGRTVTR